MQESAAGSCPHITGHSLYPNKQACTVIQQNPDSLATPLDPLLHRSLSALNRSLQTAPACLTPPGPLSDAATSWRSALNMRSAKLGVGAAVYDRLWRAHTFATITYCCCCCILTIIIVLLSALSTPNSIEAGVRTLGY